MTFRTVYTRETLPSKMLSHILSADDFPRHMIFNYSFANQPHVVWVSINTSVHYCNICSLPIKSGKILHVMLPLLVIYYVAMEVHAL